LGGVTLWRSVVQALQPERKSEQKPAALVFSGQIRL